ncbi:hypothetical protein PG994_000574 [Apiospora phragmitis]|uniref:Uncharacterized protein n=1 Tax=Apiospora phragmitis TaxID=2905665 RepID=A0ABR1X6U7_9PEZI
MPGPHSGSSRNDISKRAFGLFGQSLRIDQGSTDLVPSCGLAPGSPAPHRAGVAHNMGISSPKQKAHSVLMANQVFGINVWDDFGS